MLHVGLGFDAKRQATREQKTELCYTMITPLLGASKVLPLTSVLHPQRHTNFLANGLPKTFSLLTPEAHAPTFWMSNGGKKFSQKPTHTTRVHPPWSTPVALAAVPVPLNRRKLAEASLMLCIRLLPKQELNIRLQSP